MNKAGKDQLEQELTGDNCSELHHHESPSPSPLYPYTNPLYQASSYILSGHQTSISTFQKPMRNKGNCGGLGSQKQTVFQWLIHLSLAVFLFFPAETCVSHSPCWRMFLMHDVCVCLQPADQQGLGAVGKGANDHRITAATTNAVRSHSGSFWLSHLTKGERKE